jgi:hypothetical protein
VQALAVMPNGDLIAAGGFPGVGCRRRHCALGRRGLDPLGAGCNSPVRCLAVAPNGDLFATGSFTRQAASLAPASRAGTARRRALGSGLGLFAASARRVAQWRHRGRRQLRDGWRRRRQPHRALERQRVDAARHGPRQGRSPRWRRIPTARSSSAAALRPRVARPPPTSRAGTAPTWQAFGAGCNANVLAVSVLGDGALAVGGDFTQAGGAAAGRFAQLASIAPTLTATGNGCAGAGGTPALTVERLPLLGGSDRTRCTNLPTNTIVLSVLGLSATMLPLAAASNT